MPTPFFSIITVCRNAAFHIEACLASVATQDYTNVEHVVIDGASTDGTQDVIARHDRRGGAFISEADDGIYDAMNKGVDRARGDYLLFLGADDYLFDSAVLSDVAEILAQAPADVLYGGLHVRRPNGEATIFHPPPPADALDFMIAGCLPHQATFAARSVFGQLGKFDTKYRVHADYDWFLRVLGAERLRIRHTERVISSFALGGESSQLEKSQHEVFAIQNQFSPYRSERWMQRRLAVFQEQALSYRVRLASVENAAPPAAPPTPAAGPAPPLQALAPALAQTPGSAPELPIHFLTIVLNGEPFIRYHIEMMKQLPFRWHWHIVEGVASLVRDTAWSVATGGRIDGSFHDRGRSNDGASAYLDALAAEFPDRVTIYRKPLDEFWDGKLEMVSAPLANIREPCLLWQIDADELWTSQQVTAVREAFARKPDATAAYFWCHYFVGPKALISTRYNYAQNPNQDWLRVWRYLPGDAWEAHEPPTLVRRRKGGPPIDLGRACPMSQDEMEALGAVFEHYAYVTPAQAQFKERYYGYADAEARWRALQDAVERESPLMLRDYFPWVTDETMVDTAERLGVSPMATVTDDAWRFQQPAQNAAPRSGKPSATNADIVIDGVFFQHNQVSGIARVWRHLLEEWRASGFAERIVLLDRAGTAPRLPGLRLRSIPAWDETKTGADAFMLQEVCDKLGAQVFISSYYSTPITTPSVFVAHDFIPELLQDGSQTTVWREKRLGIAHAAAHICVSESTKRDLLSFFPDIDAARVTVALNAISSAFTPASAEDVAALRRRHNITRPYFLIVGERIGVSGYKNTPAFLAALRKWDKYEAFEVVCVGGGERLEAEIAAHARGVKIQRIAASDAELRAAYSGATALIYPSRLEGFGLPLLEAMACGCPVVTTRSSALGEVAGDAAIFIEPNSESSVIAALERVSQPEERARLIALGFARAKTFNWRDTAATYARVIDQTLAELRAGAIAKPSPLWATVRAEQRRHQSEVQEIWAAARRAGAAPTATAPAIASTSGLTSAIARSPLRGPLFAARGLLLRTLPPTALPAARRIWRVVMGVKA